MGKIIDLHCDTIMRFYEGNHFDGMDAHINREKIQKANSFAQCFAIFVPTFDAASNHGIMDGPNDYLEKAYAAFLQELALNKDILRQARTVEELEQNEKEDMINAILTIEDGVTLDGNLANVDHYREMGVRMVALTWNYENTLGFPNHADPERHKMGLKPFGIEAVRYMNECGIVVDVSHLSEGGFWDVVKYSDKPFVASHSCCRSLCDHSRNLTDEQLRAVAEKGGVVGVNFCTGFLRQGAILGALATTKYEEVAEHLQHMKKVAGIETLAFGSDFDGISCKMEWGDISGMPSLVDYLSKTFTDDEIEKICYQNALRVFSETW